MTCQGRPQARRSRLSLTGQDACATSCFSQMGLPCACLFALPSFYTRLISTLLHSLLDFLFAGFLYMLR